jgi:hypothetical protein
MSDVEHPDDLLSALLDGELRVPEAEAVLAHVEGCPACTAELAAVRAARWQLRTLPGLVPPIDLRPAEPRVPRWTAGTATAALVVAMLLVVALGDRPASVVLPDMALAVDRHAAAATAVGHEGPGRLDPFGTADVALQSRSFAGLSGSLTAPRRLGPYALVAAFEAADGVQLVYERGPYGLSVFEQVGGLDTHRLPAEGHWSQGVWRWDEAAAGDRVAVAQRGDAVITVVGDESSAAVQAAARSFPSTHDGGLVRRVARGTDRIFDALSPFG